MVKSATVQVVALVEQRTDRLLNLLVSQIVLTFGEGALFLLGLWSPAPFHLWYRPEGVLTALGLTLLLYGAGGAIAALDAGPAGQWLGLASGAVHWATWLVIEAFVGWPLISSHWVLPLNTVPSWTIMALLVCALAAAMAGGRLASRFPRPPVANGSHAGPAGKQARVAVSALLIVTGGLTWGTIRWWQSLEPTTKPEDVSIDAALYPPGQATQPAQIDGHKWSLEVTLRVRGGRMHGPPESWFGMAFPYMDGTLAPFWDFVVRNPSPTFEEGNDIWIGGHSQLTPLTVQALRQAGMEALGDAVSSQHGFAYFSSRPSFSIRYFFLPPWPSEPESKTFVVYSHYERRWGKDLSWSRAYPVRLGP